MNERREQAIRKERELARVVTGLLRPTPQFPHLGDQIMGILRHTFISGVSGPLYEIRGDQACCAIEILYDAFKRASALNAPDYNGARDLLRRRLCKLSRESGQMPSRAILNNVMFPHRQVYGAGGFADVHRGTYNGEDVAVKGLRAFKMMVPSKQENAKKEFYREAILWFTIRPHENILPFYGIHEGASRYDFYMISPWMALGNVFNRVENLANGNPSLQLKAVSSSRLKVIIDEYLRQIACGLSHLHGEGIVHGDLRGPNVFVSSNGTVALADFGFTVIADVGSSYTKPGGIGAAGWRAPELLDPDEIPRPSFKSDIYAFGCVCVELYNRSPPFPKLNDILISVKVLRGGRPPRPTQLKMSDGLWEIVQRCWGQLPEARPESKDILRSLPSNQSQRRR